MPSISGLIQGIYLTLLLHCTLTEYALKPKSVSSAEETGALDEVIVDTDDGRQPPGSVFVAFPLFATQLMTRDQCMRQFTANCRPPGFSAHNCSRQQGLLLKCEKHVKPRELQQLALSLSQPPLKAVRVDLFDGEVVTFDILSPLRELTVAFRLSHCRSSRTTSKLSKLRFPNLLEFTVADCFDLDVRRGDFWNSAKLRLIQFVSSTLRSLEAGTFTDLPALRLLTLEGGWRDSDLYERRVQEYLSRLHCSCEYQWFRQWWAVNGLLRGAGEGEVYEIQYASWANLKISKDDVFLPINCAAPFPNGSASVDFAQEMYSINDERFGEKWHPECKNDSSAQRSYPVWTSDPATEEVCRVVTKMKCWENVNLNYGHCENFTADEEAAFGVCFTPDGILQELREQTPALARLLPRPIELTLTGNQTGLVTAADLDPIRHLVTSFNIVSCISDRSTNKIFEYDLFNTLQLWVERCDNLDVRREDFQRSLQLRDITFVKTTIRTLEADAFSDLPELRVLSLEYGIYHKEVGVENPVFSERYRSYLRRLHCGCEFAGFRRWWKNSALVRDGWEDFNIVFKFKISWIAGLFLPGDVYVPIDCAVDMPTGPAAVDLNQTEFSRNEDNCELMGNTNVRNGG